MMRKQLLSTTVDTGTIEYFNRIANRYDISRSKAVELVALSNECEVDMTTLDYIYTNLFKSIDGRKKEFRNEI